MKGFRKFQPDLIVEVTGVCDRACSGCYAPNMISKFSPVELYRVKPEMFLTSDRLDDVLSGLKSNADSIAIRGGEPSRHPYLTDILRIAHKKAKQVYVETHARWVLDESQAANILTVCSDLGTTIKVSFDSMHGLSANDLKAITDRLSTAKIQWVVAITENTEDKFLAIRALCPWVLDNRIIFQKKAASLHELIEPRIGIIKLNGNLSRTLTVKSDFFLKPALAGVGI